MNSLAIVIPLYNESACLPGLIDELDELIEKIDAQIQVFAVNDGSKDNTGTLLVEFAQTRPWLVVVDQENGGHGDAILNGYHKACLSGAHWVFQCDSDQQIPLKEFIPLWNSRKTNQAILTIRAKRQDPSERLLVSKFLKVIIKLLFGLSIADANCPFRLFPSERLKEYLKFVPTTSFAPNVFLSIIFFNGSAVKETTVTHLARQGGTNSINKLNLLKICKRCIFEILNFWYQRKKWPKHHHISHYSS